MSNVDHAIVPSGFVRPPCIASFIAADGTVAKPLFFPYGEAAAAGNQPLFSGGGTVLDIQATSSDSSARDFRVWQCSKLTTQDTTATGALSTTASTLVRVNGSWITDGFRVGMQVMTFAPFGLAPNTGVDGIPGIITAVTATTITVHGTPFGVSAGLAAGTLVAAVNSEYVVTVPANAGNNAATGNAPILANTNDRSLLTYEEKLSATSFMAVQPLVAVSALPAVIGFDTTVARY